MKKLLFKTEIENANFYIASIAIGVLEGMKSKNIPLEVGIWSLGRPVFWKEIKKHSLVSKKLLKIISGMDEFDLLESLQGDAYSEIEKSLQVLYDFQKKALNDTPNLVIHSGIED